MLLRLSASAAEGPLAAADSTRACGSTPLRRRSHLLLLTAPTPETLRQLSTSEAEGPGDSAFAAEGSPAAAGSTRALDADEGLICCCDSARLRRRCHLLLLTAPGPETLRCLSVAAVEGPLGPRLLLLLIEAGPESLRRRSASAADGLPVVADSA